MSTNERNWTPEQKEAIDNRNGTLIVSAAAGSGKTAVLVERVIKRITDTNTPCDADKLLIVTFTRAATAEMRARLEKAIREELKKDPTNEHLQKQQMLLPSANIFTIDAFCANLVRENFETLGITADFSMLDESEVKVMQKQAVSTVMETLYAEDSNEFRQLVELTSSSSNDDSVEENIIKLYKYSRAYPSPNKWLSDALIEYSSNSALKDSVFGKAARKNALEFLSFHEGRLELAAQSLNSIPELVGCNAIGIIENELELNRKLQTLVENFEFENALSTVKEFTPLKWSVPKDFTNHAEVLFAKDIRTAHKDALKRDDKLSRYLCSGEKEFSEDLIFLSPLAEKLVEAVRLFDDELIKLKVEKNAFDFSDIELMALKLLVENPDENDISRIKRTPLAEDLCLQFEEILIDEYQDTNKAQDMIFSALSRNLGNLFMVGDVKQSIYGFRQAMPEIFLEKKTTLDNSVILGKNFRSREGVTQYINFIFSKIMTENCGGTDYSDEEKLVFGAEYYNEDSSNADLPEVEMHILNTSKGTNSLEAEAKLIANFINQKVESGIANYKDFAILMQTTKKRAPVIEKVLSEHGIPVYSEAGGNFFETKDISAMISFLRVIDNPLQDVPLMSLLLSPIFSFTTDDISMIRIMSRSGNLYSAVLNAKDSDDELLSQKCKTFINELGRYRRLSSTLSAGELIRQIYEDTSFPSIVAAMPGGKQRTANLHLLTKYADNYDKGGTYGISGFVRYIDKLIENDIDQTPAGIMSENANVVRIMTIHKSKGLEFKYCILADTNKNFNKMDQIQNLILHTALGIGIRGRDLTTGNTYPTLMHSAIKFETDRNQMSETLRVLYVALTRAREKLIIAGSVSGKVESLIDKSVLNSEKTHPFAVRHTNSLLELLLLATISHPAAKCFRDLSNYNCKVSTAGFDMICKLYSSEDVEELLNSIPFEGSVSECIPENNDLIAELKERMAYEYPYAKLSEVLTKRSASKTNETEFSSQFFATARPDFMSKSGLTPAERGTCLHKFMQYTDFDLLAEVSSGKESPKQAILDALQAELDRLVKEKYLSELEATSIDLEKAYKFFTSDIFARLKASSLIMREKKFAVLVPASSFDTEILCDEPVLIQGIADCVFEENDAFVVLDYKTDRETDEQILISRHRPQLETYANALSQIFDKPVSSAYIYSFSLGKEIKVI